MSESPETLLSTEVLDLRITGEHPVPQWLQSEEEPTPLVRAALDYNFECNDVFVYVTMLGLGGNDGKGEAARDEQ